MEKEYIQQQSEGKIEHELFDVSILLKAIHAIIEIIAGVFAIFVTPAFIFQSLNIITFGELTETPPDSFTRYLLTLAQSFSVGTQEFIIFYLLIHGVVNLAIVIGLFKKKIWMYHVSFVVLTLFVIYQMYEYLHNYSIPLLALTVFDIVMIWLIWREYKRLTNHGTAI